MVDSLGVLLDTPWGVAWDDPSVRRVAAWMVDLKAASLADGGAGKKVEMTVDWWDALKVETRDGLMDDSWVVR